MAGDKISIVIPVLNDLAALQNLLPGLQDARGKGHEVLVVDGGSTDGSVTYARSLADRVLMTGTGRGRQMNLGVEYARQNILLFLHADSKLPGDGLARIQQAMDDPERHWGRFDVQLDDTGAAFALISAMMNLRSRITGVATGDQGIFVRKRAFLDAGGYREIALMEDVALSKALRRRSRPVCLDSRLTTSARRWRRDGVVRTILLMWRLRLAYFFGADPDILARSYYPGDDPDD